MKPELSSACWQAEKAFAVPRCTSPEFASALLDICRRERADLLVPTIDPELGVLSEHRDAFEKAGTRVVLSSPEVVRLAHDKIATVAAFHEAGVSVPRTVRLNELRAMPDLLSWPVIAKPNAGSASVGIALLATPAQLDLFSDDQDMIAQARWQGVEYTVNLFFDRDGKLRSCVPHERVEVRSGEVSKGVTRRVPVLAEAAQKIAGALRGAMGPLCFQAIQRDDGAIAVFEINARFGGGYPLAHRAGARFSQWLLEEALGRSCAANDDWREGVIMLRYDAAIFING